ncbi:radical SAM protein [Candidatus Woesearchaeota archaeon]|nr:radical SAM protein [Candidatus Woesearchaeota archaeon]
MQKVLLLNPPGTRIYIRDYYCSKVSKASYVYQPTDLLILSGRLHGKYDLKVIDAIVEKLPVDETLRQIIKYAPDFVIFLAGSVSWDEDKEFLQLVKQALPNVKLIGTGDIFNEDTVLRLEHYPFIDAIILDFTTPDILDYLDGRDAMNMVYRKDGKIVDGKAIRQRFATYDFPVPRHELFKNEMYRFPFIRKYPFATVLSDYGCPFRCSFCIMSQIGFKTRGVDSVMAELRYLKQLGMKEIYFDDQTFGVNRKRAEEILNRMLEEKFDFGWVCFSRADVVNEQSLQLWKKAGCHTIMFGVESGNQEIMNRQRKDLTKDKLRNAFALCKKLGIKTLGTFIFGLEGDNEQTMRETIDFAKELGMDYAAFNILVPRMGTLDRQTALQEGRVDKAQEVMDQSGSFVVMGNKIVTAEQLQHWQKRAYREFYLRPKYIYQRLTGIKTWSEFRVQVGDGMAVVKKALFGA